MASEDDVFEEAGKVLGQMEKIAASELAKADKNAKKLKRAYLTAAAKDAVWLKIASRIEEGSEMGEDMEGFAEDLGITIEDFGKSNAKTLIQRMSSDAKEEAMEFLGDDGIKDFLDLDDNELRKLINKIRF